MEELICRARAGDGKAFAALMESQKQTLYKVARSYLRSDADAADAIGDTVLSCWEKLSTLRRPEYFRTWLVRILIRKCQDILRQRGRVVTLEEALVGDYLPKTGYVWQVGEYTLTVESYLLDEHTGAGRVYFTLERPGGVEELARVSAIGMLLQVPDVDQVKRVALEYADGTSYVVCDRAADLDNTEYALSWTRREGQGLTLVFNRLADPDQVRAVTVDGVRYSVE